MPPHHRITKPDSHLPCPLPPNQSVICLAPCHQTSQSFDLPSTTASPCHHVTMPPHHRVTVLFSHLPCPLPPNQSVIWLALYHRITTSPHHCITASQYHHITMLVICLAPCHQTSQSFALPPAAKPVSHLTCPLPLHHHVTAPSCHHVTVSAC